MAAPPHSGTRCGYSNGVVPSVDTVAADVPGRVERHLDPHRRRRCGPGPSCRRGSRRACHKSAQADSPGAFRPATLRSRQRVTGEPQPSDWALPAGRDPRPGTSHPEDLRASTAIGFTSGVVRPVRVKRAQRTLAWPRVPSLGEEGDWVRGETSDRRNEIAEAVPKQVEVGVIIDVGRPADYEGNGSHRPDDPGWIPGGGPGGLLAGVERSGTPHRARARAPSAVPSRWHHHRHGQTGYGCVNWTDWKLLFWVWPVGTA